MTDPAALPPLPSDAAHHSRAVCAHVRALIEEAGGALPFHRYMEAVLYAPGLGYYSAGSGKLGESGDFVTAPEMGDLFGRCVARNLPVGPEDAVLEVGAGSGALAAQVLAALERDARLPARYLILERSADLRERQAATLARQVAHLADRVQWLDDLPSSGFRGAVIANELLDALPAARFRVGEHGIEECYVRARGERLDIFFDEPTTGWLPAAAGALLDALPDPLAPGYVSELSPAREAWVRALGERLERGVALLFDYGYPRAEYYHPQRTTGTLRCHYRHRAHDDPLLHPGLQDLSVHVDFTALAHAAGESALDVVGFTTQGEFLLASGILDLCAEAEPGTARYARLAGQVRTLTLPGEMGEAVKVLALARGPVGDLPGLTGRDRRARL